MYNLKSIKSIAVRNYQKLQAEKSRITAEQIWLKEKIKARTQLVEARKTSIKNFFSLVWKEIDKLEQQYLNENDEAAEKFKQEEMMY